MNIDPILGLELRSPVKFVLTVLAFRAYQDDHEAHMTNALLQAQTCLSRRGVQNAVQELETLGLIDVRRGWGKGAYNIYTINMEKVHEMHPKLSSMGASAAHKAEKHLPEAKGAQNAQKGAQNDGKGAENAPKDAQDAPNKTKKYKNKTHARKTRAGKLPPRTGPKGPAAKGSKNAPAVNRANGAGGPVGKNRRPDFHETTDTEARTIWSQCLQGSQPTFALPIHALLGPIEHGKAIIRNLTAFERDQIEQKGTNYALARALSQQVGEKIQVTMTN